MAGIPAEHVDRLLGEEWIRHNAVDCPIRYEVWQEFALWGPNHRPSVLLELAAASAAGDEVIDSILSVDAPESGEATGSSRARLRTGDEWVPVALLGPIGRMRSFDQAQQSTFGFGEWTVVRPQLHQVLAMLRFTEWRSVIEVIERMTPEHLRVVLSGGATDETSVESQEPRWSEQVRWLLRLSARLWGFDTDFPAEREGAVEMMQRVQRSMSERSTSPTMQVRSMSLNRRASASAVVSRQTVKVDATSAVFDVRCSGLVWAIIDSGIHAKHEAFAGGDANEPKSRVTRVIDFTAIDQDGLRQLRHQSGRSLVATVDSLARLQLDDDPDGTIAYYDPITSHGTHVAAILAGAGSATDENSSLGMCPDLRLWDLRVLDDNEEGFEDRVLLALQYVRECNHHAGESLLVAGVNMSLSIPYNPRTFACGWTPVCKETRRLIRSGVVVVAAAGNTGFDRTAGLRTSGKGYQLAGITDPGNTEEAITVGSTDAAEPTRVGASYFSSKGPTADGRTKPDILAPGQGIWSASGTKGYRPMDGTSQAAPHVSGAAALLMARNSALIGDPERVKKILVESATDLGRHQWFQGRGLLDSLRAMQAI